MFKEFQKCFLSIPIVIRFLADGERMYIASQQGGGTGFSKPQSMLERHLLLSWGGDSLTSCTGGFKKIIL